MTEKLNGSKKGKITRLLRHRGSQQYFKGDGWTANPEAAKHFSDIIEVAETCARNGLTDVEVALRVELCEVFCTSVR